MRRVAMSDSDKLELVKVLTEKGMTGRRAVRCAERLMRTSQERELDYWFGLGILTISIAGTLGALLIWGQFHPPLCTITYAQGLATSICNK